MGHVLTTDGLHLLCIVFSHCVGPRRADCVTLTCFLIVDVGHRDKIIITFLLENNTKTLLLKDQSDQESFQ